MCEQNRGAKESLGRIKGPVDIGDHEFILVPIIPICTVWFSPDVHSSTGPPIDDVSVGLIQAGISARPVPGKDN